MKYTEWKDMKKTAAPSIADYAGRFVHLCDVDFDLQYGYGRTR